MTARGVERVPANGVGQGIEAAAQSAACGKLCRLHVRRALVMIGAAIRVENRRASAVAGGRPPHAQPAPLIGIETGCQKFRVIGAKKSDQGPIAGVGAGRFRAGGGAKGRVRAGTRDAAAPGRGALP